MSDPTNICKKYSFVETAACVPGASLGIPMKLGLMLLCIHGLCYAQFLHHRVIYSYTSEAFML